MRSVLSFSLMIISFGCSSTKSVTAKPGELNGVWVPIHQEMGGQQLPASFYEKQKLTITDNTYTLVAESVDKGEVNYNGNKMDIYGKDGVNNGKHFTAIFKIENGQLAICYNLAGDSYPKAFETKDQPMFFLSVFKKSNEK